MMALMVMIKKRLTAKKDKAEMAWQATILSLFPDMFPGPLGLSLAGRALEQDIWNMNKVQIRDFATDKHHMVDDTPLGGGAGMVLKPNVVSDALASVADAPGPRIYFSPRGRLLDQKLVRELAAGPGAVMVCGRYEGLDQRVIDHHQLMEVSVGDYILAGGELAALVTLDAVIRLLDGVMGKTISHEDESFETGLLEYPHYTQPRLWQGLAAPDVLLSGHHKHIADWRQKQAEEITKTRRPDLWQKYLQNRDDKD